MLAFRNLLDATWEPNILPSLSYQYDSEPSKSKAKAFDEFAASEITAKRLTRLLLVNQLFTAESLIHYRLRLRLRKILLW
jgi:hypothetical protein